MKPLILIVQNLTAHRLCFIRKGYKIQKINLFEIFNFSLEISCLMRNNSYTT